MYGIVRDKTLTFWELLTVSYSIFKNKYPTIAALTLTVYLPVNSFLAFYGKKVAAAPFSHGSYFNLVILLDALFGVLTVMGTAFVVERTVNGEDARYGESLKKAFSRWGIAVGTNLLTALILIFLFLLLIVPGIVWSVYYSFVIQVVVLRSIGGKQALAYSKSLVQGSWWRVFAITFTLGVLNLALGSLIMVETESPAFNALLMTLVDLVSSYFLVAITVLFLNLDYRKGTRSERQIPA